ncbi:hypothetical protein JCM6882_003962 [Rhodosporidiobolus microsporus]
MAQIKRERSPSAAPPAAPASASSSIKSTIALLSTAQDVPPALYAQLLASLGKAHGLAVKQEQREDERDQKRVKREVESVPAAAEDSKEEEAQPAEAEQEEQPAWPALPRWGFANVQGELSELERVVLKEIEATLPLLDKLGILLRPVKQSDGRIDLTVWETALPMPTTSNWARALPKAQVFFPPCYPEKPPKIKFRAGLYHPNLYPSGTLGAYGKKCGRSLSDYLKCWPGSADELRAKGSLSEQQNQAPVEESYACLPASLFAFEEADKPCQLEPYQAYNAKVHDLILTLLPTPLDHEDLIEAQRRVAWREKSGVVVSMEG